MTTKESAEEHKQEKPLISTSVTGKILGIILLALLIRIYSICLFVDFEYDGYDRFVKGILLLSEPYNIILHWYWLPLFQYIDAVLYWLTGSYTSIRVFSTASGIISILIVYKLAFRLSHSERTGLISACLVAFNPLMLTYDITGMTESFFTMLFLSSIYFLISNRLLLLSISSAVACLVRYEAWFLSLFLCLVFLIQKRSSFWKIFLVSFLPIMSIGSWLYLNHIQYGNSLTFVIYLNTYLQTVSQHISSIIEYLSPFEGEIVKTALIIRQYFSPLWYIFGYSVLLSPPVFIGSVLQIKKCARKNQDQIAITTIVVVYVALLTYFLVSGRSEGWLRYSMPTVPLLTIFGVQYIQKKKGFFKPNWFLVISLFLALLLLSPVFLGMTNSEYSKTCIKTSVWLHENATNGKILCLRTPIIVLSQIPVENFVFLWTRNINPVAFRGFLEQHKITYVVSHFGYFDELCESFSIVYESENKIYRVYSVNWNATLEKVNLCARSHIR